MSTQTRNEDLERELLGPYFVFVADHWEDDERAGLFSMAAYVTIALPKVLAAERRATVERIRERLDEATSHGALGIGSHVYSGMLAILDEEAARGT